MVSDLFFFAKFLEILTTGSLENGTFLLKQSVSIFRATAHALHLTGSFGNKQRLKIAGFFRIVTFCNIQLFQLRLSDKSLKLKGKTEG